MTVTAKVLVPAKTIESSQTTQYTATNVRAIIDKFTATNYSASAVTVSVNLVTSGDSAASANLISKLRPPKPIRSRSWWVRYWQQAGSSQPSPAPRRPSTCESQVVKSPDK